MTTEPQFFTPSPKKKLSKKAKIVLLISIPCAILLVAAITVGIILSSPKVAIARSLSNAANDLMERPEIKPAVDLIQSGSVEIAATIADSASIEGKIYTDADSLRVFAENVKITVNGKTYTAEAYVGPDQIYASSDELLNGCYGITAGEAVESFEGSKLSKDDKETYYMITSALDFYDSEQLEEFLKDYAKIRKANAAQKFKLALKYGKLTSDKRDQRIGNDVIKVTVYKLGLDQDALDIIDSHYLDYLSTNKALEKFLHKYERLFVGIAGKDPDFESIDEIFEEYISAERDNLYNSRKSMFKYTFQLSAQPLLGKAYSFSMTKTSTFANESSFDTTFAIESDENGFKNAKKLLLNNDGTKITYEIKENTNQNFIAKITAKDDWTDLEGLFKFNKESERFTFVLKDEGEEFASASGSLNMDNGVNTLKLQELTIEGVSTKLSGEIIFREDDEIPATYQNTKNIFTQFDEEAFRNEMYDFLNDSFEELEKHFDF